jgi:uncharacterized protein
MLPFMSFLPDFPTTTFALLALAALAAGLSRGFSGFGAALIFVPAASALVGPKLAAAILVVIDPIFASFMIPAAFKIAERKSVALMFAGAMLGVPIGTAVLMHYPPLTLRWLIAIMATAMLALLASGWRYRGKPHEIATIVVGAISGLFTGIAQIGGPAVVCYWMGTGADPAKLRANIILFFAASSVLTVISYFWGGIMGAEVVKLSLIAGPAYGLGILGGNKMFPLASPAFFRNSSLVLIAFAVVMSLPVWG